MSCGIKNYSKYYQYLSIKYKSQLRIYWLSIGNQL